MVNRIIKNEERFDILLSCIKELQQALDKFDRNQEHLLLLTKYYSSKDWLRDKEKYESNLIPKIKAGVLSEDGVWNMLSDIDEIMINMKRIIKDYEKNK